MLYCVVIICLLSCIKRTKKKQNFSGTHTQSPWAHAHPGTDLVKGLKRAPSQPADRHYTARGGIGLWGCTSFTATMCYSHKQALLVLHPSRSTKWPSDMLNQTGLQLVGVAGMICRHTLTTGISPSKLTFSHCSKEYNHFVCIYLQKVTILALSWRKAPWRKCTGPAGDTGTPLRYYAKPVRCTWWLWHLSQGFLNTEQSKSQQRDRNF